MMWLLTFMSLSAVSVAQFCQNFGYQNGSNCACPPGFGGVNCSQPACGGDIFQGSNRHLVPLPTSGSTFPNITSSNCSCESGWTGTDCNVCQSANACQAAFAASGGTTPNDTSSVGNVQNNTMVCSAKPQVYAASHMSCQVLNPTVQNIYPRSTTFNILRTLQPSLTPYPNITAFGAPNSIYAQLWYDGVEQFYCQAQSCQQNVQQDQTAVWGCQNLQCVCIRGTSFCGGGTLDITETINTLNGALAISCSPLDNTMAATCNFTQSVLQSLFGPSGLTLHGCTFGECVRQSVIDTTTISSPDSNPPSKHLGGGVIAGLVVIGALLLAVLLLLAIGLYEQKKALRRGPNSGSWDKARGVGVDWTGISYIVPGVSGTGKWFSKSRKGGEVYNDKVILDDLSGYVKPGQIMAVLGPSGAGKTTLVEILAGKSKTGRVTGRVSFSSEGNTTVTRNPRIGFVPQQDILPPMLTVYEAFMFAARLRLPESIPEEDKRSRVEVVMEKLGIQELRNQRIGSSGGGGKRGISGGEMRRVSIGLELIAKPDVLLLDEPTSGLDSVSAAKVAHVLHAVAHDPESPTAVIASIHQPSSQLYQIFDLVLLLSHGHALYCGSGSFAPIGHFARNNAAVPPYTQGYNIADYLIEVASDPPIAMFQAQSEQRESHSPSGKVEKLNAADKIEKGANLPEGSKSRSSESLSRIQFAKRTPYATTFMTQLQVIFGREWKILRRDKTLFFTHVVVAAVLGVFCGGLYFRTDTTIAGFQSRVGCLFFIGALVAFTSLSALYTIIEIRPLFLRERSSSYYSPTAWLLSRFVFDVIPLRIIPTMIVSTITYWMAGLAHDAAHFFKFLLILVLYTLVMTLFNFLLGTLFNNGGIAILLSALTALYQMTFAGFFAHLSSIPPVLRWLQWLCPLKYTLEALCVNEVGSGLIIQDKLQGVPVSVSASLIMQLLFGFGINNYYRDVLVLFAFIAGFGMGVIAVVWIKVKERR